MRNIIAERLKKNAAVGDEGFSLIELVVSIGVMLTLSVSSLTVCVKDIQKNIENDATESVVKATYAEAFQNERGFDENYTAGTAALKWQETADAGNVVLSAGTVEVDANTPDCVWVKGVNDNGYTYVYSTNDECSDQ